MFYKRDLLTSRFYFTYNTNLENTSYLLLASAEMNTCQFTESIENS